MPTECLKTLNPGSAKRLPVRRGKVDGLVEVEAMVESGVIGLRESEDKLACPLIYRIHVDSGLAKFVRRHQRHKLEKKIWLALE